MLRQRFQRFSNSVFSNAQFGHLNYVSVLMALGGFIWNVLELFYNLLSHEFSENVVTIAYY